MDEITIVIPCYNMEYKIEKCINSIKNQSYKKFIALFIDDGSQDNTAKVIKESIKGDARLKYYYKENGGLSSARNFGINKTTTKYICFVDSDDYIEPDYIKLLYDSIRKNDCDMSICYINRIYDNFTNLNKVTNNNYDMLRFPAAWNKMYKTSLFKQNKILYPIGRWYEDLPVFAKLLMISKKIIIVEKPLYNYVFSSSSSSIMHTYDNRIFQMYDNVEDIEKFAKQNKIYDSYFSEIEYINIYHILIGIVYKNSFFKNFSIKDIKNVVNYIVKKYPYWYKNEGIKRLPFSFKVYLFLIKNKLYFVIYFILKLFKSRLKV